MPSTPQPRRDGFPGEGDAARASGSHARREPIVAGAAQGVKRGETRVGASEVSAARTRTMDASGTREFRPVDYQAPEQPQDRAADSIDVSRLGRAHGVSSLRDGHMSRSQEGRRDAQGHKKSMVPIIVIVAVLVCALVVGMFFLFRSALLSVDGNAAQDSSATYATDAYVLFAVSGDDGTLVAAYVGYVDSINGRTELCRVEAASRSDLATSEGGAQTLADDFAARGLEGLTMTLERMGDIDIKASLSLSSQEMDAVIDLASGAGDSVEPGGLAGQICEDEGQQITQSALRGLLVTIADIGPEGLVELSAPTMEGSQEGDEGAVIIDEQQWVTMLRGMRDVASDVSL